MYTKWTHFVKNEANNTAFVNYTVHIISCLPPPIVQGFLFFLLFPLCRGEAGLLVTAKYGYFRD